MPTIVSYWFMDCKLIHAHHMTIIYISNNDIKNTIGLDMYYIYRFFILVNVFIYTYIYIIYIYMHIYIIYIHIYIHNVVNFKYRSLVPFLVIIQMALASQAPKQNTKIKNIRYLFLYCPAFCQKRTQTYEETAHERRFKSQASTSTVQGLLGDMPAAQCQRGD